MGGETSNMHYLTNRLARDQSCLAPGKCLNPYCSLYDCYERNDKPLCAGEKYDGKNIPKEAKVGIHHNIKETVVKGWTRRLYEDYARHHARDMRTIINDWNTNNLWMFIGAQHANDKGNDYYMGAFAPTRKVFARCNNSRHCGYRTLPLLTASTVPTGTASPTGPSVSPPATRSAFALLTPTACGAATTLDTVPTTVSRGTCTTGTPLAGVLATPRP